MMYIAFSFAERCSFVACRCFALVSKAFVGNIFCLSIQETVVCGLIRVMADHDPNYILFRFVSWFSACAYIAPHCVYTTL